MTNKQLRLFVWLFLAIIGSGLSAVAADFKDFSVIVNNQDGTLLTAEEQTEGVAINFGVAVADDGTVSRVAADDASAVATVSGKFHKQKTNYRSGARKAYQHQCECHKENSQHTAGALCLAIYGRSPTCRKSNLKQSYETQSEHQQHKEEKNIEYRIRSQTVQGICTKKEPSLSVPGLHILQ